MLGIQLINCTEVRGTVGISVIDVGEDMGIWEKQRQTKQTHETSF